MLNKVTSRFLSGQKIIIVLFLLAAGFGFSKNLFADDFEKAMLKAKKNYKIAYDEFSEDGLLKVRGEFERILQLKQDVWLVYYYMGLCDYNLSWLYMSEKNKDSEKMKKYTESGLAMMDKCWESKEDFAELYVLRMALNFNRWQYEQDKMEDIIGASQKADEGAKKYDANNPRYHLYKGISAFYMPASFGGGAENALTSLLKSYDIFQVRTEPAEYYPDWGYDLDCGYLCLAYLKRNNDGDIEKAKTYLDKGLAASPDNSFLKGYVTKQYEEKVKK
jgi:hypothetical protein